MKINQFAVYQVKDGAEYREIRFRPYDELQQKNIRVCSDSYNQVYLSYMSPKETVENLHARFQQRLPRNFPGHSISTSDVYVVNRDGVVSAFYVDCDKLIVLTGFLRLNSSGTLISMDTTGYRIEGKGGSWVACEELIVDGRQFFLMQSEDYRENAAYVILSEDGKIAVESCKGFDEAAIEQIRKYLHPPEEQKPAPTKPPLENWQKYLENGEYLRSAEMSEEQNYSFIDGRINNLPKPRVIGGRVSALDRLHIKQAEMAIRNGKPVPEHIINRSDERSRK
ncbi:MAG: YodL domain-containing protein [Lachnospiraceae bacterium]|nr:YodL domain-containing protein [Lachnospiraceae bacterium]